MQDSSTPTAREVIAGYQRFNEWELAERRRELPRLAVEDALRQFFELCRLARAFNLDRDTSLKATELKQAAWIALYRRAANGPLS
jgi:hypothetical protein